MKKSRSILAALAVSLTGLAVLLFLISVVPAAADSWHQDEPATIPFTDAQESVQAASKWLVGSHQNDDGGFTGFSVGANQAPSDVGGTIDAILGLAASSVDLSPSATYLRQNASELATYVSQDGSTAGKAIVALTLAGEDVRDYGGYNFVISLTNHLSPTGQFRVSTAFNQSLAILGLVAASEMVPRESVDWLIDQQAIEGEYVGSWDDGFGTPGNADATAMSIMALTGAGVKDSNESIVASVDFLSRSQLSSGGWEYGLGLGESANSTALVIQALIVLGQDVSSEQSIWIVDDLSPLMALMAWQSESGAFQADFGEGRFDDFFSTVQSIPAVALAAGQAPPATIGETVESEVAPAQEATELPATSVSSQVTPPSPTSTATPDQGPPIAGGDSVLPFWIIGGVVLLLVVIILALFGRRR